jgi:deoxyribose-phosphate aldolase
MTNSEIAKMIDHTNLKAFARTADIEKLCKEAAENKFASVCVNSVWVKKAAQMLSGTDVEICTVVGFPLGACNHDTKAFEAGSAVKDGATEVDMVIDIGAVKDGRWDDVEEDISGVVVAVQKASEESGRKGLVKVILENCYLEKDEIAQACRVCVKAGADFVKTSTGFGTGGATAEDVKLMRETVGKDVGVKAAGGIRDRATAISMIEAGANRIGCSAGIAIIKG